MPALEQNIAALTARGARLRALGGPCFLACAALAVIAMVIVWPSPASNSILSQSQLVAPPELTVWLERQGVYVHRMPANSLWPGEQILRVQAVCVLLLSLALWWLLRPLLASGLVRFGVVSVLWPLLFIPVGMVFYDGRLPSLPVGHISERSGQPVRTKGVPVRSGGHADNGTAFQLRAEAVPGNLRDQAHYLLAQQAYHDDTPEVVASHLRALTGAWQPADNLNRTIVGVLQTYATAHGQAASQVASSIADGRPHHDVRKAITRALMWAAAALLLATVWLELTGIRRVRVAQRLAGKIQGARSAGKKAGSGAQSGFGLRTAKLRPESASAISGPTNFTP